jgi:pimeloyl-ACP methyl ester carboxylesterase
MAQASRPKKAPDPVDVKLVTKDGVTLTITYYESLVGKEAVPIVMLTDWKDARSVYDSLARRLQNPGENDKFPSFAVVTVDLRGHGDSTKQVLPTGAKRELDAAKLGRQDFAAMITQDMEAVRKFLVDKNDAGQLNLNKLSLLGAGMGASIATNWAAIDWSAPPLAVKKQGQDVKALILVSPEWKWQSVPVQEALRQPGLREKVAVMMMYGKRDRGIAADVKRIYTQLEKLHPEPPAGSKKSRDLVVLPADNSLQGTQLLKEAGPAAEQRITGFLNEHVVAAEHSWLQRRID